MMPATGSSYCFHKRISIQEPAADVNIPFSDLIIIFQDIKECVQKLQTDTLKSRVIGLCSTCNCVIVYLKK